MGASFGRARGVRLVGVGVRGRDRVGVGVRVRVRVRVARLVVCVVAAVHGGRLVRVRVRDGVRGRVEG